MSTTPAFSPGPCTTSLPRVGSRFRCTLLDLYEQCSLHITEKIPSSVMFGSRPRICFTRAYSSAVRPCSAAISGVTLISVLAVAMPAPRIKGAQHATPLQENSAVLRKSSGRLCRSNQRFDHGAENHQPIGRVQRGFSRALRMRHQAGHVALVIADSRNVGCRTVGIPGCVIRSLRRRVAKNQLPIFLEVRKCCVVASVIPVAMRDRNLENLALGGGVRKRRIRLLHPDVDVAADEPQAAVAHHRARQQTRLQQNLKPVADPQHHPTAFRKLADRFHYRRKSRNRACAQIVPIGEPARQNNGVAIGQVLRLVPDELHRSLEDVADGVKRVVIAVGARKDNYSKFHAVIAPWASEENPFYHIQPSSSGISKSEQRFSFRLFSEPDGSRPAKRRSRLAEFVAISICFQTALIRFAFSFLSVLMC